MKFSVESKVFYRTIGAGLTFALGFTACGADSKTKPVDRNAEVARLASDYEVAKTVVADDQSNIVEYEISLPPDCLSATKTYRQGESQSDVAIETANERIAPWCGPDNLGALVDLRWLEENLEADSEKLAEIGESLQANLAAAGVTVPPTHG